MHFIFKRGRGFRNADNYHNFLRPENYLDDQTLALILPAMSNSKQYNTSNKVLGSWCIYLTMHFYYRKRGRQGSDSYDRNYHK